MSPLRRLPPLFADAVRVSLIMGSGDLLAQSFIEKRKPAELDLVRTAKFSSLGLVFVGPTLSVWYRALDRIVAKQQSPFKRALKKMLLDQSCFAPVITLAMTGLVSAINGETPPQIRERIRRDYWTIMQRGYMLWPAAQMINFSVVPMQYQVAFVQVVAIIWNCYLSMVLNSESSSSSISSGENDIEKQKPEKI